MARFNRNNRRFGQNKSEFESIISNNNNNINNNSNTVGNINPNSNNTNRRSIIVNDIRTNNTPSINTVVPVQLTKEQVLSRSIDSIVVQLFGKDRNPFFPNTGVSSEQLDAELNVNDPELTINNNNSITTKLNARLRMVRSPFLVRRLNQEEWQLPAVSREMNDRNILTWLIVKEDDYNQIYGLFRMNDSPFNRRVVMMDSEAIRLDLMARTEQLKRLEAEQEREMFQYMLDREARMQQFFETKRREELERLARQELEGLTEEDLFS